MPKPEWAVTINGVVYKPGNLENLRRWVAERRLHELNYVLRPGGSVWLLAKDVHELDSAFAPIEAKRRDSQSFAVALIVTIVAGVLIVSWLSQPKSSSSEPAQAAAVAPAPERAAAVEPAPIVVSNSDAVRTAKAQELVKLLPIFESFQIDGIVTRFQLVPSAWNSLSHDQQDQICDELARKQIVRDIGSPIHLYVMSTKVGAIRQKWTGDWVFERKE